MGSSMNIFKKFWMKDTFRMVLIAAGIVVCFFVYGIMQEKVMRGCFGGTKENGKCTGDRYTYELTLVLIYCTWYTIFAKVLILFNNKFECLHAPEKDITYPGWYVLTATCYIGAMVFSNMSLRWINYPTQVIAKSSKPIPVMILGVVLAGRRYTLQKYFFVVLIVIGVILFVYKEGKAASGDENSLFGLTLVAMSLLSDGILGGIEEKIRLTTNPKALNIMYSINFFSAIILFFGVIITQEVFGFYDFVQRHPDVLVKIAAAALVGSVGQIFIFLMISCFGSLPCSIATTTRKLFTVLASVIFLGNPLITRQWIAMIIVFSALFADVFIGNKDLFKHQAENVEINENDIEKGTDNGVKIEIQEMNGRKEEVKV